MKKIMSIVMLLFLSITFGTAQKITLHFEKTKLKEVLSKIEKDTGYTFSYSSQVIDTNQTVSINLESIELSEALFKLFSPIDIGYSITKNNKILLKNKLDKVYDRKKTLTIRGKVMDSNEVAIIGASILVKGTAIGETTKLDGSFTIANVPVNGTIQVSYIGYKTLEISTNSDLSRIILREDSQMLDEVVVVGYGKQRKENLTGAVSSVDVEKALGSRPITDVGRGLQGTIPGLSITVPSGEVGSDPIMKIRGQIASLSGSTAPLILVDNVEIPSIQIINPNDIESISVLKDAAASSIYGSKAAFGVILITTKKGQKEEKTTITYSSNVSYQSPFKKIDIAGIDGLEYALEAHENMKGSGPAGGFWRVNRESFEKIKEWQKKYGSTVGNHSPVVYGRDWYYDGKDKFGLRIYNPAEVMIKDVAFTQKHDLSVSGRNANTIYTISLGYLGQEGMMKPAKHDDFKRYTSNIKLSTKVKDNITIRAGAMYSDRTKRYPNSSTGFAADPWLYIYRWSRLFPIGATEHGKELRDPYFDTKNANDATRRNKYVNINFGTTIDINKNWDIVANYAYSTRQNLFLSSRPTFEGGYHWFSPIAWKDDTGNQVYVDEDGNPTETGGQPAYKFPYVQYIRKDRTYIYQSSRNFEKHTLNAYSTYNLNFDDIHRFKFMLGTNIVSSEWDFHSSKKTELINNKNPQFNFAVGTETVGGDTNWDSQVGFFGRMNYSFLDKYLLEANLRYDATSKFPSHLRWKWYPSFSAGWVLSRENFMENLKPVLSFAKLRGSWGTIGDQSVSNSLYIATMGIQKNSWLNSQGEQFFQLNTPRPISSGITWQDIESLNIGIDLGFFDNKLGFVFEWFERNTRNMIIPGNALPATYGASAPRGNYGNLRTRGWEFAIDFRHRFSNGIGVNVKGTLSDATSFITKGADWNIPYENRSLRNSFATGRRYGDIYGYVTDRLYQADDFVYDSNGKMVQETIVWQGTSKVTNKLSGENPVYQTYFEDGNQILLISPGDVKFVDVNGDGYITPGKNTFGDPGDQVVIGNFTPRYEFGLRLAGDYKGFDASLFFQGVGKRKIWGKGQLAIPGFHVKDGAMPQAIAGNFWKKDRTDAFYPRAWHLGGRNSGFVMRPQSRYLLNMAYLKVKNITLGYTLPKNILRKIYLSNARVYLSFENFITFDKLRGLPIDPETISGYSMLRPGGNYNLGRTGISNPTFKSASLGIQITL